MVINGKIETGTMVTKIPDLTELKTGEFVVLEEGYYNAGHVLHTTPLANQTSATATNEDVADGFIGWANGNKIIGNFTSRGSAGEITPAIYMQKDPDEDKFNVAFPKGFYSGENPKIEISLENLLTAIGLTSDKIADGSTILNINGDFTRGAVLDSTRLEEYKIAYKDGEKITGDLQAQSVTNIQITKPSYRSIRVTWANPNIGPYQGVRVYLKSGDTIVRSFIGSGAAITPNAINYTTFDYIPDGDYTITVESYAGELISPVYFTQNVSIDIASTRLLPGTSFQAKIPTNITSITRRYGVLSTAEINSAIDLSNTQNKSVLLLRIGSGTTYNIWSESYNIYLNANSYRMFRDRTSLRTIDTTGWITTDVTNMSEMFYNCQALTLLDLNSFNTIKVQQMRYMFYNCKNLRTVYYGTNFRPTAITNLKTHASSNNTWYMFNTSPAPKPVNYWTSSGIQAKWLDNGTYTTLVDVYMTTGGNFNARINKNMMYFVRSTTMPTSGYSDISRDGDGSIRTWYNSSNRTQYWWTLTNENVFLHASSDHMFNECRYLTSLNMSGWNWNTTNVTTMYAMFNYNTALTSINFGSVWSTNNVTDMRYMFRGCNVITSIGISGWNTAKVIRMDYMFSETTNLKTLNISSFNTANVTNMSYMFYNSGLTNITYGSGFVNTKLKILKKSEIISDSIAATLGSYQMFYKCKAHKPTWKNGIWGKEYILVRGESYADTAPILVEGSFIAGSLGSGVAYLDRAKIMNTNLELTDSSGNKLTLYSDDHYISFKHISPDEYPGLGYYQEYIRSKDRVTVYRPWLISTDEGLDIEIWGWRDRDTSNRYMEIITQADTIVMPSDMSWLFHHLGSKIKESARSGSFSQYFSIRDPITNENTYYYEYPLTLDTSNVTNMNNCFRDWESGAAIEIANNFNDVSKVTDMSYMFYNCNIDYTRGYNADFEWNSISLKNMAYMFYSNNGKQRERYITYTLHMDTSNVTNMQSCFEWCQFGVLDISTWDTSKVQNMHKMFFNMHDIDDEDKGVNILWGDKFVFDGMLANASFYQESIYNPTYQMIYPSEFTSGFDGPTAYPPLWEGKGWYYRTEYGSSSRRDVLTFVKS